MQRISTPGAVDSKFVEANPFANVPGTVVSSVWLNNVQEEILAVIESAGLVPSAKQNNQLLAGMQSLFGASPGILQGASGAQLPGAELPRTDSRTPLILCSQSGQWIAGVTTEAPTQGTGSGGSGPGAADNTDQANEVDTGVYPGDCWAFQSVGAQMEHDTAGSFPAVLSGTNVNWARHGFFLPASLFVNGAALEIALSGLFHSTENRIVEVIAEPEYDPDAAFDTAKAFAFQTGTISSTGGSDNAVEIKLTLRALGYDDGASEWLVAGKMEYHVANSPTAATTSGERMIFKRIPIAKADFSTETLWNVRFKTDDPGATLGDEGNSSGSAQDGASGVLEVNHYAVTLFPGAH